MTKKLLHTPEGVRDIYGNEYIRKLQIEQKLHDCIKLYGYQDIQTPTFEFLDVFSKEIGTTPSIDLYKFFDKEGNTLVLRPDFTPSIARCASMYFAEKSCPIRFSYLGNTFTNTSNLQGKLKEVTQLGAELIGDSSVQADAEIICMVIESLKKLGLKQFRVTIGEVDYFKGICEEAGIDEETEHIIRDNIAGKNFFAVQEILDEKDIDSKCKETILQIADLFGDMSDLASAKSLVINERSLHALERLDCLYEVLKQYGIEEYVSFDLGMLSKLNYYTGIIFEAYTYGLGDAVVKGGRYDKLLQQFGKDAPAIGFCIVVDDLMEALDHQKIFYNITTVKEIHYDADSMESYHEKLNEAKSLRDQGIAVALIPSNSNEEVL